MIHILYISLLEQEIETPRIRRKKTHVSGFFTDFATEIAWLPRQYLQILGKSWKAGIAGEWGWPGHIKMEQSPWEMMDSWLLCAWIYLSCILYTVGFICIYIYHSPATILSWMVDLKAVLLGWGQGRTRFTEGYGVSGSLPNLSNLNGWIIWLQILKRGVLWA